MDIWVKRPLMGCSIATACPVPQCQETLRMNFLIMVFTLSLFNHSGALGVKLVPKDGIAREGRLLMSSGVADVSNSYDFIAALMNPEVNHMILTAPVVDFHPDTWRNVAVELPILISRNVTTEGNESDWPLLRFHYVKDMVRLQGNVTWMLRFVFIDGVFGENIYREQGFDILAPTLSGEWSEVLIGPAALSFRFCFPLEYQQANLQLTDRPARYPGRQQMLFNCTQTGCANGSAVPPLRRCWMAKGCMVDVAGVGVRVDPTWDQPVPTNTYFRMNNVSGFCEYLVDYRCLLERQSEPLVCYMNLVNQHRNDTTNFLDDYQPQIGQEKWILSVITPPPPPLATATRLNGSGNRSAASMVGASVAGAVVGLLVVSAAVVVGVVYLKRRLRWRTYPGGDGVSNLASSNSSSRSAKAPPSPGTTGAAETFALTQFSISTNLQIASMNNNELAMDYSAEGLSPFIMKYTSHDLCKEEAQVQLTYSDTVNDLVTPSTKPKPDVDLSIRIVGGSHHCRLSRLRQTSMTTTRHGRIIGKHDPEILAIEDGPGRHQADDVQRVASTATMKENDCDAGSSRALTKYSDGIFPVVRDYWDMTYMSQDVESDKAGNAGGSSSIVYHGSSNRDVGSAVELSQVVRGKGAFGRVVEGMYGGQRVAVKLLASDGPWGEPTETFIRCFAQELQVLSRCEHPNVVRLLAACVDPPRLCLVLELMETSLERLIHGDPTAPLMPLPKVLHIAISIANALAYLHPTIIHRDLKPANVLINDPQSDRPLVKLTDFGLARLRVTVAPTAHPDEGTPPYMAPECFDVQDSCVTHQADIFSLGVLLWEMLTGKRPWAGLQNPLAVALLVAYNGARLPLGDLDPQRCPQKLARLINACWERDPARRPAAAEAAKELTLVRQQIQLQPLQPTSPRTPPSQQQAERDQHPTTDTASDITIVPCDPTPPDTIVPVLLPSPNECVNEDTCVRQQQGLSYR